ncbi:pyruvate kinase [bacterium SCSIO 12643]|nr:pyruvate kinase [bacterium SCSIO 12643]
MNAPKRTKIVATLGPATSSRETIKQLILEGVNVCRINFSHAVHQDLIETIKTIRELDHELNTHTGILGDLQGPKIRIGNLYSEPIMLEQGHQMTFTTKPYLGDIDKVHINYESFPKDVEIGDKILVDDGKLVFKVVESNGMDEALLEVVYGGPLHSRKGVNLPDTKISMPSLTEKDLKDLEFALEQNIHWIGLSFVREAKDIIELREIITGKEKDSRIIAKIEKPEAIKNLDDIIEVTDAVMVARGDLGVEVPLEEVPLLQKEIVLKCQQMAKPVIIATQMMESMIDSITPSRAEVNDVANAVMDGADAVMLSGETSVGEHPVDVIKVMTRIIKQTETFDGIYNADFQPLINTKRYISDNICFGALDLAEKVSAKAIVTMTFSGYTALKVSSFRPKAGVYVFTGNRRLLKMMSLVWGTRTFFYDKFVSTDETIEDIKAKLRATGQLEEDDLVVNIASMPIKSKGMSNMIRLSYI